MEINILYKGRSMYRSIDENLAPIISLLYDGVTQSCDWHDGLDAIRKNVGGAVFHHFTMNCDDLSVIEGLANYEAPADKIREYESVHVKDDIRMPMAIGMPVGGVVLDHEYFDARLMSRSAIYSDWLASLGLRHTLGLKLRAEDGVMDVLGIIRAKEDAPFDAQARAFCERLMPHLSRASELRARMANLVIHAEIGLSALDSMPRGVVVTDEKCRIQYINPAAERLLQENGDSQGRRGRLSFPVGAAQTRFEQLLAQACKPRQPAIAGAFRLERCGREALMVSVLPLKANHPLAAFRQIRLALVVISAPAEAPVVSAQTLTNLLGVTPSEAKLALLLAAGRTVKHFAAAQACSEHTARSHLKSLMRKCGCHRQADIIRLVHAIQQA